MRNTETSAAPGRYTALGYRAAKVARESGRAIASGGSGDLHLRADRSMLLRQSQEFYRDNGLYEGVINRAVDNIIGDGFSLQARTDDPKTNTQLEELWREYWMSPEVRGMDSGYDTERLALTHLWVDGDVGAIKTKSGQLQLIESEQIGSNKTSLFNRTIEDGVELNQFGKPVAFYVSGYDRNGHVQKSKATRLAADDFMYLTNRKRASQTRGVPVMVSNFPMFHRINDICDAEAVAWQLLSRIALIVTREDAEAKAFGRSGTDEVAGDKPPSLSDRIQDFDYGMIFHGEPGEKVAGADRNLPGKEFTASLTMFIRLLGLPVGFPLELILLDWSKTNYSSARAALEQAFRMFQCWQRRLKMGLHMPTYTWKVEEWVREGRVAKRSDITRHEWICPAFPWIDQLKEAEAWGERIDRGLATLGQACKSLNQDREEWLRQRIREVEEAIKAADEINKKNPQAKVPWQIFCGIKPDKAAPSAPEKVEKGKEDAKAAA